VELENVTSLGTIDFGPLTVSEYLLWGLKTCTTMGLGIVGTEKGVLWLWLVEQSRAVISCMSLPSLANRLMSGYSQIDVTSIIKPSESQKPMSSASSLPPNIPMRHS
jgi:hypothetical protein